MGLSFLADKLQLITGRLQDLLKLLALNPSQLLHDLELSASQSAHRVWDRVVRLLSLLYELWAVIAHD
jgi:hypothetical protein